MLLKMYTSDNTLKFIIVSLYTSNVFFHVYEHRLHSYSKIIITEVFAAAFSAFHAIIIAFWCEACQINVSFKIVAQSFFL